MNPIEFSLNGQPVVARCRADMTVLEWLRGEALLRGTKEGCAEGDCGACSVLLRRAKAQGPKQNYAPVNSCILLMGQIDGASLMTVEGLAQTGDSGHTVQLEMAKNGASQCGFCTPGIVVSLAGLLDRKKQPQEQDIHDALAGNLCRCTGYRPIVEAAQKAILQKENAKLRAGKSAPAKDVAGNEASKFLAPKDVKSLLALKKKHPDAVLLGGGTDLALDVSHAKARWPLALLTSNVDELRRVEKTSSHLEIGAAITWQEMLPHIEKHWLSFATLIRRFGSVQIRSMGTIGGNLGTASPIGDGPPCLLALGAELTLVRQGGSRRIALKDYFKSYRETDLRKGEIIQAIHIPLPKRSHAFRVYKISKRYDQDISTVCAAFWVERKGQVVTDARIAFGGMAAIPERCKAAEKALTGSTLDNGDIVRAKDAVLNAFTPMSDMRGTMEYRAQVAANLVDRFINDLSGETVEVMAL